MKTTQGTLSVTRTWTGINTAYFNYVDGIQVLFDD